MYMRRSKDDSWRVKMEVTDPPDLRGSAYLLITKPLDADNLDEADLEGVEMFVYLPELKKVRRITPRTVTGSLFGTDFTYEDFRHLHDVGQGAEVERLPDAELDGRTVYVVDGTPTPDSGSEYSKVVSKIDRETCVVLRTEFFEDAKLVKILEIDPDKIEKAGESWLPRLVTVSDLEDGGVTTLTVDELAVDEKVSRRHFDLGGLARGH